MDPGWPLRTGMEFSDSPSRALAKFPLCFGCLALLTGISLSGTQLLLAGLEPSHRIHMCQAISRLRLANQLTLRTGRTINTATYFSNIIVLRQPELY